MEGDDSMKSDRNEVREMNGFVELRPVIGSVLRWWWLLVVATVVAATIGYAVSQRQTPVYEASATLLVGPPLQSTRLDRGEVQAGQMLAQTYAAIALQQPVLQKVVDALDLADPWPVLRSRVRTEPVTGTQLLQIGVEASPQEEARLTVDQIARELIALSTTEPPSGESDVNQQFVRQRLQSLRARIEAGQKSLEAKEKELADSPTDSDRQQLQSEISTLEGLIASWIRNYTDFLSFSNADQSPGHLTLMVPAVASSRSDRLRPLINMIVLGGVGLFLALVVIYVLETLPKQTGYLTRTFRPAAETSRMIRSKTQ